MKLESSSPAAHTNVICFRMNYACASRSFIQLYFSPHVFESLYLVIRLLDDYPINIAYLFTSRTKVHKLSRWQLLILYDIIMGIGESGLPWAAFFQTALKLFLHSLNRMLLVLLETEYNKVWLTRIKNSIFKRYIIVIHSSLHLARVSVVAYAKWMLFFNVSECKQSGPYELLSIVRLTATGKRITRCLFDEWKRVRKICPLARTDVER